MILKIFFFTFLISFFYSKNLQENKSLSKETSDIFDKEYTPYLFYYNLLPQNFNILVWWTPWIDIKLY